MSERHCHDYVHIQQQLVGVIEGTDTDIEYTGFDQLKLFLCTLQ